MEKVKEFYKDIPFNFTEDIDFYLKNITTTNQILEYQDLHDLLNSRISFKQKNEIKNVIEFGCGTGWLTNSIAYYYNKNVTSVDFTKKAIEIASLVSKKLSVDIKYQISDIFNFQSSNTYDLVVSLGVLHHTKDCKAAFKKISNYVKKNGYLYIGLYHLYGRRPMLQYLQGYSRWHGEESAYNLFKEMNNSMDDKKHSYSWFRDQVLHPHETQHTLEEIIEWVQEIGFQLVSTSINNYKSLKNYSKQKLFGMEKELESYSFNKNVIERKFSPGYFTICAKNIKQ